MNLRLRKSDPIFLATALLLSACFAVAVAVTWQILNARDTQLVESETAAANLALSLGRHASDLLVQSDLVVMAVVDRIAVDGLTQESVESVHGMLARRMPELPALQRLSVLDADGRYLATDLATVDRRIGHADREYFQYHLTHVDRGPHLGPPIRSRTTGQWILTISRRLDRPDGSFAGVAVASIDLGAFERYHARFAIGDEGAITIVSSDGLLLQRRPFRADLVGTRLSNSPLLPYMAQGATAGLIRSRSSIDGVERLVAFEKLEGFPAYLVVAIGKDEVLKNWSRESRNSGVVALLLVAVLAFVGRRLILELFRHRDGHRRVLASQADLKIRNNALDELASRDPLTGLANRRTFDRTAADELKRATRNGGPLSLIMIDVDRFKAYNDHYGHPEGDECLRAIAAKIAAGAARPGDLAARLGGEEFVLLLPATDAPGALAVAESLRRSIHALAREHAGAKQGIVTVSMGIATLDAGRDRATVEMLVAQADNALYAAKAGGRDTIRGHQPSATPTHETRTEPAYAELDA